MERTLGGLIKLLRYRFLLIAGLLPYGLAAAVAFAVHGRFSTFFFLTGLFGLFFVLLGVEAFNEFFDWQLGTDRVFQLNPKPVTKGTFLFGLASFLVALLVAVFLTWKLGLPVLIFAFLGFLGALFYLGPPLKLIYRGLGELVIALCYGPLMMMGSYYLQAGSIDTLPLLVSIVPALLLWAIAIMNEVPDYLQDRLVGKRNICVRVGPKNVVRLFVILLTLFSATVLLGYSSGSFPSLSLLALGTLPLSYLSYSIGRSTCNNPPRFLPAIRYLIIQYVLVMGLFITTFALSRSEVL